MIFILYQEVNFKICILKQKEMYRKSKHMILMLFKVCNLGGVVMEIKTIKFFYQTINLLLNHNKVVA